MILYQFSEKRNHNDGGGQVVENGRHEECENSDNPQQGFFICLGDFTRYHLKTIVAVNQFNNGHGSHEEKQNAGYVTEMK